MLCGRYLIKVINTPTSTAVTIPGTGGAVTTCISYPAKLTPEALRALASGAFLSCSGKKGSKEAGSRGEQLAPARIVPPLRIPRVEPSGIDPSLWLRCWVLAPAPVLGCDFWGALFPRCRLEDGKSPVSHHRTIPGTKRLPCQMELAKIFDF